MGGLMEENTKDGGGLFVFSISIRINLTWTKKRKKEYLDLMTLFSYHSFTFHQLYNMEM